MDCAVCNGQGAIRCLLCVELKSSPVFSHYCAREDCNRSDFHKALHQGLEPCLRLLVDRELSQWWVIASGSFLPFLFSRELISENAQLRCSSCALGLRLLSDSLLAPMSKRCLRLPQLSPLCLLRAL